MEYKKWNQLKMKEQIVASNSIRTLYMKFVLENKREPNSAEKIILVAKSFTELKEKNIFVKDNEINMYLKKKLPDFHKSIDKLK